MSTDLQDLAQHAPGAVGSLVAVFMMKDTWPRRLVLFFAGFAAAYYGSPYAALHTGADRGLAGFLTGLFSMAVIAKVYEALAAIDAKDLATRLLKRMGLTA
jgi:hypothetical protein